MTTANTNTGNLNPLFHPAAHYASPGDVLNDNELSVPEKRIILSSWASDLYAVESCPALREIPGMGRAIRLADILAALRRLDGDDDDPPRPGGLAMRQRRPLGRRTAEGRSARCLTTRLRREGRTSRCQFMRILSAAT
ncbi:hypothetical protein ACVIW2_008400 [Bradyrhizobium huanghuaihaiense]|uniref:Uncharacterized protein n=1 Tax=Bradyrhizobium huanghuaihaiense TaxID=990078 RepID=A0A562QX35_9BRAD|nr:hypothetical protein [Bradyrhizobium huanghuaihaiense]TWI61337.1 hypothetical protein IQ16_07215 [Bradyrhizobium huanghuaihaiense]